MSTPMTSPRPTAAASLSMVVGAVLAAILILAVAAGAFVVGSYWIILIGAVLALPLVAWEVWPSRRNQLRFAAALESAGHPSYLLGRPQDL